MTQLHNLIKIEVCNTYLFATNLDVSLFNKSTPIKDCAAVGTIIFFFIHFAANKETVKNLKEEVVSSSMS